MLGWVFIRFVSHGVQFRWHATWLLVAILVIMIPKGPRYP